MAIKHAGSRTRDGEQCQRKVSQQSERAAAALAT